MQPGDVGVQAVNPAGDAALGRGKPQLGGVIAEQGVSFEQVRIVLVTGDLGEVILEHPRTLAYGLQDAELAVGVVIGPQGRSPEDKIIGSPAKSVMEFVVHQRDQGRGENLPGLERLSRRILGIQVQREAVVTALANP